MNDTMQTNLFMKSAVLVEQNPIQGRLYRDVLNANGFEVDLAQSITDGIMKIKEHPQDVAIINTEIASEPFIEKFIQAVQNMQEKSGRKQTPVIGLSIYKEENKKNLSKITRLFSKVPTRSFGPCKSAMIVGCASLFFPTCRIVSNNFL